MQRIQKIIASAGICSRRKAEEMIQKGQVVVNGKVAKIGENADPTKDTIVAKGQYIKPEKKTYLMLHKPKGYITTNDDPYGRASVLELLHEDKRVFPVGRLDRDTSGMLLMTNDGDFANKIMHPRYNVKKTYEATLDTKITDGDIHKINEGVILERKKIQAQARKISNKRVRITIHTGMNKEVKRIFKSLGYWVRELKRTEIQGVKLNVKEGKYRHLVQTEIDKLVAS